jgi:hypothetical protein
MEGDVEATAFQIIAQTCVLFGLVVVLGCDVVFHGHRQFHMQRKYKNLVKISFFYIDVKYNVC